MEMYSKFGFTGKNNLRDMLSEIEEIEKTLKIDKLYFE